MSETVKVKIEAVQKIKYSQTVSVSKEDWKKYNRMCEDGCTDEAFDRAFGHYINPSDICDSDDLEDLYMTFVTDD